MAIFSKIHYHYYVVGVGYGSGEEHLFSVRKTLALNSNSHRVKKLDLLLVCDPHCDKAIYQANG